MAISIQCIHCLKRYNAPEAMAGKKVKCKHCGKVFEIPLSAADEPAQAATPGKSRTPAAAGSGAAKAADKSKAGTGKLGHPSAGFSTKIERTGAAQTLDFADNAAPVVMLRPSVPMDFPGADGLDRLAPLFMILVGLGWLALTAFQSNTTNQGWVSVVRLIAFVALEAGVMFPLGYWAIRAAARKHRFMLPPTPGLRGFACFALSFTVPLALWQSSGSTTLLIVGACLGLIMACGAVWFLFRIQSPEMNTTLGQTAIAFVGSVAIAYFALLGINTVFRSAAVRSGTNQLASSPMGPFEWDVPIGSAPDGKSQRPTVALHIPDSQPTSAPSTQESATRPTNPSTIIVDAPSTQPEHATTIPDNPGTTAVASNTNTTPPPSTTIAPAPMPPVTQRGNPPVVKPTFNPDEPASPLVAKITVLAELEGNTQVIFAPGNGNVAAAVKSDADGESVQFFAGNPLAKKGETKFEAESGVVQHYCLSPNGDTLARLVAFPKAGVQLWNVSTNRETKVVPLDPTRGAPDLLGFGWNESLVILWNKQNQPDIEVVNGRAAVPQTVALLRLRPFGISPCNPTISPDGRQAAVAAFLDEKGGIYLWDLTTTRSGAIKTCPVPLSTWAPPTGIAYGPGGAHLACYFEVNGKGVIYSFRTADASLQHEHPYRTLPYPAGSAAEFSGRTLDYMDANTWLLLGRALIDTESGKVLGDLQIDNPRSQRVVDKETILLETLDSDGKGQLLQVKLKADALLAKRNEVRGIKPKAP